jgi:methanol metabolism-related c-type cytochrome
MKIRSHLAVALFAAMAFAAAPGFAEDKKVEDGQYFDKEGNPTYNVKADGTVDWYTFSGFRRYHAECHVCHGPEGKGSTYAPALVESVKAMSYDDFKAVIIQGRNVDAAGGGASVMPSFGTNLNVVCYLDDLWTYLRARADGAIPPGRPAKKDEKPQTFTDNEKACIGH